MRGRSYGAAAQCLSGCYLRRAYACSSGTNLWYWVWTVLMNLIRAETMFWLSPSVLQPLATTFFWDARRPPLLQWYPDLHPRQPQLTQYPLRPQPQG